MQSDKPGVQALVNILQQHGLAHVVISPGSRHAPISLSFKANLSMTCYVVPDERAAGYFALGIAQYTQNAVALVCTSGTAALNYGPAIAEAFYQEVPLFVITADRPDEWIDQSDGQTIRQTGVHDLHTLASYCLKTDDAHSDVMRHNERMINHLWNTATGVVKGPVHLNVPLREPLYTLTEDTLSTPKQIIHLGREPQLGVEVISTLSKKVRSAAKVMVICGLHVPDRALQKAVEAFSELENVVVLTETTSNVHHPDHITCIDRTLMSLDSRELTPFTPDLLITYGSNIVSKKVKAFLRRDFKGEHWHIDPAGRPLDTFKKLSKVIESTPAAFFKDLAEHPAVAGDAAPAEAPQAESYRKYWSSHNRELSEKHTRIVAETPWSDLLVFSQVLKALPSNSILQMGNSSVVRYIQLFDPRNDLIYFGNRGTSGIDGCTATASGMAAVSNETVTLISGDIAFLYDINGLWHNGDRKNLRIILINNGGGNIFRIIEGPSDTEALEEIFEAKHAMTAKHLAAHFNLRYQTASNKEELKKGLNAVFTENTCDLLEVNTTEAQNDELLREMFRKLRQSNT